MSYAEYVAAEASSDTRHEYLGGEVFAMAGGTPEHGALAMAIGARLVDAVREKPCRVFGSDVRVRVLATDLATDLATYPDVSVVCGKLERAADDEHAIVNPVLIVEVLSDSTEAYDRGQKAAHYRRIPSLREYLLVSQREPWLELFRRTEHGGWEFFEAGPGGFLELVSVGARLDVDEVYRDPLG